MKRSSEHRVRSRRGSLCMRGFCKRRFISSKAAEELRTVNTGRIGDTIVQGLTIHNVFAMVIISAIVSVTDLVLRATAFLVQLPEKWYKGNLDIKRFKVDLKILSERTTLWERQLKQYGMSESPALRDILAEADKLLNTEEDEYERHKNDRSWIWRRRLFPSRLTSVLANLRKIVEAGPQILASAVETSELLTKSFLTEPLPLPFGYDPKYVPLQATVDKVQSALEDTGGSQVVTLYGEPGIGKSSLAKYVALLCQDSICGPTPSMFDGVQYLFCGRGCSTNIRQLRRAIFSNLGLGAITGANNESQEEDQSLSSHQSALRRVLADRRMLIILDDVWSEDFEVLTNLISREIPSRYLVTSQTRDVWLDARQIKMPKPTDAQALSILNRHTQGSASDGRPSLLNTSLEREMGGIIRKLECHPLSLVNVAVSMNPNAAKDPTRWKSLAQNIFTFLDENDYSARILVNERPYSLSVSASMMLMVESLPTAAERDLLFLIAMLQDESGLGVPQHLIRFFMRRLYHRNSSESTFKYFSALQYLEDNSLVQVNRSEGDSNSVENSEFIDSERMTIHSLRREYIRQKHLPALQNLASRLTAGHGGHHDGRLLLDVQDSDQCLAVALGTTCFDKSLTAQVAFPFQGLMTLMNNGEVPRSLEQPVDARELVKSARKKLFRYNVVLFSIIPLLNLEGEESWKQQVHADASKMMMKLVCTGEIHDESMASLLALSHVRAASLRILSWIYQMTCREDLSYSCYYGERKSFSDTHCATSKAFSSILRSNLTLFLNWEFRSYLRNDIVWMLQFESLRTIAAELQKLREFATQSRNPGLHDVVDYAFLNLHDSRLTSELLNGLDLQQYLPSILWKAIDEFDHVQSSSMISSDNGRFEDAMNCVYRDKGYVNVLLTFPVPLEEWLTNIPRFRQLLRLEQRYGPQSLLGLLSATPEFKARAAEIFKGDWWEEDFTQWPESLCAGAARFWGNVALLRDLRNTTRVRLVKIAESWTAAFRKCHSAVCCSTCSDSDEAISWENVREISRSMTIISHLYPNTLVIPDIKCSQQRWVRAGAWVFFSQACMGRALAYCQMEMHAEAEWFLDLAQQPVDAVLAEAENLHRLLDLSYYPEFFRHESRALMVFVKALSKDYQGAMDSLNEAAQPLDKWGVSPGAKDFLQFRLCTDRAVLFRLSGEFSKAIYNFSLSLERWENLTFQRRYIKGDPRVHNLFKYCVLQHRGSAKYLMGDLEGSQLDMKSAGDIRLSKQILEPISWDCLTCSSGGFSFLWSYEAGLNYSLLQFPVDKYQLHSS